MRQLIVTFSTSVLMFALRAQGQTPGQIRGEAISGSPIATTNVLADVPPREAKTNSAAASPTRVADGAVVGFDKLAGFPIQLNNELEGDSNIAEANAQINAMI